MGLNVFLLSMAASISTVGTGQTVADITAKSAANAEFLAKNYPPESLRRGEQGRVGFKLSFDEKGTMSACAITQSSGFAGLDNGTCEMLARSARIEAARNAQGRRVTADQSGYIDWKLPSTTTKLAQASSGASRKSADPLVCKRQDVTGSVARKIKRCMTRSQWGEAERAARADITSAVTKARCNEHGCTD